MRFKQYASKKVIAVVLAFILATSCFTKQQYKIKDLQRELYIQTNITEQRLNYTETHIDVESLQEKLNELCEYKIFNGTINVKHKYSYQRDSILGLKSKFDLVGTADFYYEYIVNLSNAEVRISENNETILLIDSPELNEETCHRVANTFVRMDDECDSNMLANKNDTEIATRHWEDTFDTKCIDNVKEYYSYTDKQENINDIAVQQINKLLDELGYSRNIYVKIK